MDLDAWQVVTAPVLILRITSQLRAHSPRDLSSTSGPNNGGRYLINSASLIQGLPSRSNRELVPPSQLSELAGSASS